MKIASSIAIAITLGLLLAGCDDEEHADLAGGGPGSSNPVDVTASGDGFCDPQGGAQALGVPSYASSSTAKIDTDGNPLMEGHDATWQAGTSGTVNGEPVNSALYAYVVVGPDQLRNDGISLGDWATVTNNETGKTVFARVEDQGPQGGQGEISQAAATAVDIQYLDNSDTVGNPSVTVQVFGGTSSIQGDCSAFANNS